MLAAKKLELAYPKITCWTWQTNLFAILGTYPESDAWIYSNYIQLMCRMDESHQNRKLFLDYVPSAVFSLTECAYTEHQIIYRDSIKRLYNNHIEKFLVECIESDQYIYGVFNEAPLLKREHQDAPFFHELFIFGYDYESKTFDAADFTFTGTYSFQKLPMDLVCKGFQDVTDADDFLFKEHSCIYLIRKRNGICYQFDPQLVVKNLYAYLYPENAYDYSRVRFNQAKERVSGIDVYGMIEQFLSLAVNGQADFDVRVLHDLYEHKVLMVERIKYMIQNHHLHLPEEIIEEFSAIRDKVLQLRNKCIKLMVINDSDARGIEQMIATLENIKNKEIYLYEMVIRNTHVIGLLQ